MTENNTFNIKCSFCGRYANRSVAVDALIIKNSEILLIKRKCHPHKGKWALPGGHVDWNETVEEALHREVFEETGLKVTDKKLSGIYSDPKRHRDQVIAVAYQVTASGIPKAGSDAQDIKYFPLGNLPRNLAFDHAEIIKSRL